jgi:hypothetical protein
MKGTQFLTYKAEMPYPTGCKGHFVYNYQLYAATSTVLCTAYLLSQLIYLDESAPCWFLERALHYLPYCHLKRLCTTYEFFN